MKLKFLVGTFCLVAASFVYYEKPGSSINTFDNKHVINEVSLQIINTSKNATKNNQHVKGETQEFHAAPLTDVITNESSSYRISSEPSWQSQAIGWHKEKIDTLERKTLLSMYSKYMVFEPDWEFDFDYVLSSITHLEKDQLPFVSMPHYCWDSTGKFHHAGSLLTVGEHQYMCETIGYEGDTPMHYWESVGI